MTPERAQHIEALDKLISRYGGKESGIAPVRVDLLEAMRAELAGEDEAAFDLTTHLTQPSRCNPMASAFAVNARRAVL